MKSFCNTSCRSVHTVPMRFDHHRKFRPVTWATARRYALALLLGFVISSEADAAIRVFTCEPEWAALTNELGGERVVTDSATTAFQDVHFIQARPSLIAKVRRIGFRSSKS